MKHHERDTLNMNVSHENAKKMSILTPFVKISRLSKKYTPKGGVPLKPDRFTLQGVCTESGTPADFTRREFELRARSSRTSSVSPKRELW